MKKRAELERILKPIGVRVLLAEEAGVELTDVEETGVTFEENAFLKAASGCKESGMPCIADDSGLAVDALDGAPGVYSARYAGEHGNDEKNNELLLKNLSDIPMDKRTARFVSTVCCCFPDGRHMTVRGECEGKIAFEPAGEGGFGYDPLFLPDEFPGKTMAQLTAEEKDSISHRGKALRLLAKKTGGNYMTSKERAALRAQANSLEPLFQVGKGGVNDALIAQTLDAFRSRELLKLKVLLETAPKPPREIAEEIAAKTQSEVVQVVGGSLIFFKENPELHEPKDKKKKITGTKNPNRPSVRKKVHEKKLAEERKTAARRKAERNFRRSRDI
mgnify:FL=1